MSEEQLDMLGTDLDQIIENLDKLTDDDLKSAWPVTLANLVEVFKAAFARKGLSEKQALELAQHAVVAQAHYMGGREFYLPRGDSLQRALRNMQVWQEFNGRNIDALMAKYGFTRQGIAKILREQRSLARKKVQLPLL
ncbi:Mor transcription activator family protein [Gallaecimonas kandeliae]|uniref:Mor transcription activator family protein n=1 Tax=Gallaecimonas kandeliae TaxID=3029055 RepID=UPI0026473B6C|nr:Mor transcription activator family protein [Gallaecimonas kandeliae]WKE64355.1 Mor transcription activator family protein [Gallaecimonas kandeliae]